MEIRVERLKPDNAGLFVDEHRAKPVGDNIVELVKKFVCKLRLHVSMPVFHGVISHNLYTFSYERVCTFNMVYMIASKY